jgi:3-methyladenine DNA glycosylase AlkD
MRGDLQALSVTQIIDEFKRLGHPKSLTGMARYGIKTDKAFGVSVPKLRQIARKIGRSHNLAKQLWQTGIHDARLLAGMIDDPQKVTEDQMEAWAAGFDSWDVVDGSCGNLFDKTPYAIQKAKEWAERREEYVKRAGFVLMAELAVHDKKLGDNEFMKFLPLIVRESSDNRNFVKKAVNWALRQIGKRNLTLNRAAIRTCKDMQKAASSSSSKWIAVDALRELTSPQVKERLRKLAKPN